MRRNRLAGVAGLVLVALVVAACGSSGASSRSSDAKPTLTLYSGQHEETTSALVKAFTAQTGIKVKVRADDEAVLAQLIAQEGSASRADVFYTENSPPLTLLENKRLLAPLDAATMSEVPKRYSSPDRAWLGISARVAAIVYNTKALKPSEVPRSVLDLADSRWKGKLAISPGETDFQPIVTAIAQSKGDAAALRWLKAVKANGAAHDYPDNETLVAQVDKGQASLGVINHYYWFRLQRENGRSNVHSALSYFAPRDLGYVLDVSGAGVVRSSAHRAEAEDLVRFLASSKGEQILAASDSFEYPVGSKVSANAELKPFGALEPNALTIADLGDGTRALKLLQQAQLL